MKLVHATSVAVENEDTEQQLSHNSWKRHNKIDSQAAGITPVKAELNKALQENKELKDLFNPEKMVEATTKVVSAMTMKEHQKHCTALSTKEPLIMHIGSDNSSWHMVPMGHWSQTPPATT